MLARLTCKLNTSIGKVWKSQVIGNACTKANQQVIQLRLKSIEYYKKCQTQTDLYSNEDQNTILWQNKLPC